MRNSKTKTALSFLPLLAALLVFETPSITAPDGTSIQLFFTADLHGYLKPCG